MRTPGCFITESMNALTKASLVESYDLAKLEAATEALDASAHKAIALVQKLQHLADAFTKEQMLVVKELQKLGYDRDATDWISDAWGHIEGTHNQYAKKLIGFIQSGKQ